MELRAVIFNHVKHQCCVHVSAGWLECSIINASSVNYPVGLPAELQSIFAKHQPIFAASLM